MSLPSLEKAVLIPFERDADQPNDDEKITLDFNPATLSIEVNNSLEEGRGSQARQTVKETVSNLSFEAVFDSTHSSIEVEQPEDLDVRRRTQKLVGLLGRGADEENGGGGGSRVPARVRFKWGTIIFDGVFSSYSETLDYFSPEGIPLRARVSIQLTEQEFQYRVEDHAGLAGLGRDSGGAGEGAAPTSEDPLAEDDDSWSVADAASGLGSALGGGFGAEFGASLEAGFGIGASVGISGSFGVSAGVEASFGLGASVSTGFALEGSVELGIDVSAELGADVDLGVAAGVFGEGLFAGSEGKDLNPAVEISSQVQSSTRPPGLPATISLPWSAEAPAPGTLAGRVAADVARNRSASPAQPGERRSAPLAGAPPTVLPAVGPPPKAVFAPTVPKGRVRGGLLPLWEVEPPPSIELAETCCHRCGGTLSRPPGRRPSPPKTSKRCRCAD